MDDNKVDGYISVTDLAKELRVDSKAIRNRARDMDAMKVGRTYFLTKAQADGIRADPPLPRRRWTLIDENITQKMVDEGRYVARSLYPPRPCAVCGEQKSERHHKDVDPTNNTPENIVFLCDKHHKKAHSRLRKRGQLELDL